MPKERTRRLAAVWFADIVGYTTLSSKDEDGALALVDELQRIAREAVEARNGRIVKFVGDAVLTVFDSTDAAVRAALELQESFSALELVQEKECALRVGVHVGEVVEAEDGDVYGDGVNLAARIEGVAGPGQVAVSEDVWRQIRQREDLPTYRLGAQTLKGVEEPVEIWALGEGQDASGTARRGRAGGGGLASRLVPPVAAVLAVAGAGAYLAGSMAETRAELVNVVATEVSFVVGAGGGGGTASSTPDGPSVVSTQPMPVREILLDRIAGVYVPRAERPDGTPFPGGDYDTDILLIAPAQGGTVQLDPLEVPAGTELVARGATGAEGFEITADQGTEVEISVRGGVTVTVPGGVDGVLDFGPAGGRISIRAGDDGFLAALVPVGPEAGCADCATAILNLPVSHLELSTVEETVGMEASTAQRVSTLRSGALSLPGLERELRPSEILRFGSFTGTVGRMELAGDSIRLDAAATQVTGLQSSLGGDLMPTRFASMGTGQRVVWGTALLALILLLLFAPRFMRSDG